MGALARATRRELEAEVAQNPEFWDDVLAGIADGKNLKAVCRDHAWAFGEVYRQIRADEKLSAAYDAALAAKAEGLVHDAVEWVGDVRVEDVPVAKLLSDVAFKAAGKWDRARYGDKVEISETRRYVIEVPMVSVSTDAWRDAVQGRVTEKVVEALPVEAPVAAAGGSQ